jgi:hypothetical protein
MPAFPMDRFDLDGKSAHDLWTRLFEACGDSEFLDAALDEFAVRAGISRACPDCDSVWDWDEPVGPCELCADDE